MAATTLSHDPTFASWPYSNDTTVTSTSKHQDSWRTMHTNGIPSLIPSQWEMAICLTPDKFLPPNILGNLCSFRKNIGKKKPT